MASNAARHLAASTSVGVLKASSPSVWSASDEILGSCSQDYAQELSVVSDGDVIVAQGTRTLWDWGGPLMIAFGPRFSGNGASLIPDWDMTATYPYVDTVQRHSAEDALAQIASFSDNWDGYGAIAMPQEVISNVKDLLTDLPSNAANPEIFPTPHGTIVLEWREDDETFLTVEYGIKNYVALTPAQSDKGSIPRGIPEFVSNILATHTVVLHVATALPWRAADNS